MAFDPDVSKGGAQNGACPFGFPLHREKLPPPKKKKKKQTGRKEKKHQTHTHTHTHLQWLQKLKLKPCFSGIKPMFPQLPASATTANRPGLSGCKRVGVDRLSPKVDFWCNPGRELPEIERERERERARDIGRSVRKRTCCLCSLARRALLQICNLRSCCRGLQDCTLCFIFCFYLYCLKVRGIRSHNEKLGKRRFGALRNSDVASLGPLSWTPSPQGLRRPRPFRP